MMTRRAISFSENNGDNNKQPAKQDVVMEAQRSKQSTNESIRKKKRENKKTKRKRHIATSVSLSQDKAEHRPTGLKFCSTLYDTETPLQKKKKKEINQLVR